MLLGKTDLDSKKIINVWQTENSWNDQAAIEFASIEGLEKRESSKTRSFSIAPVEMLKAQKEARKSNCCIMGIYHSHPDAPAVPSEFDRAIAYQQYSYIIVSVQQGKAVDLQCWILDDHNQFQQEIIIVTKN